MLPIVGTLVAASLTPVTWAQAPQGAAIGPPSFRDLRAESHGPATGLPGTAPFADLLHLARPAFADVVQSAAAAQWAPLSVIDRHDATYVFDPVDRRVYAIGGYQATLHPSSPADPFRDYTSSAAVLDLDGPLAWRPVVVTGDWTGPLGNATAVVDPERHRMLLYGGLSDSYDTAAQLVTCQSDFGLHEVRLDGRLVARDLKPPPGASRPPDRYNHASMWDPLRHRMLVFGGIHADTGRRSCYGPSLTDLWELTDTDPPAWHLLTTVGAVPRTGARGQMIFDARRDRALFTVGGKVWELSLGPEYRFTQISGRGTAPYTYGLAALDSDFDRLLVQSFDLTYALSLSGTPEWTVVARGGPPARWDTAPVFDDKARRFFLLGTAAGSCGSPPHGWVLDLSNGVPQWSTPSLGAPPRSAGASLVFDELEDRLLLVALESGGHRFGEVWQLDPARPQGWTLAQATAGRPPARVGQSLVLDTKRQRLLMFAGYTGTVPANDSTTWTLPLDGTSEWEPLPVTGFGVPNRSWGAAIYDPKRDRVLYLDGIAFEQDEATRYSNELWELPLDQPVGWRRLEATHDGPTIGAFRSAVYDPVRDRMIVVGGSHPSQSRLATWALDLSDSPRWGRVADFLPSGFGLSEAIYDPVRDRIVALSASDAQSYGTWTLALADPAAGWQMEGNRWADAAPLFRGPFGATYDPIRDAMVIAGGGPPFPDFCERPDSWALTWGTPVRDISVDFEPHDPTNTANPRSRGLTEVALFGARHADMATVDLTTVKVGLAPVVMRHHSGPMAQLADLNHDGLRDLLVWVRISAIALAETSKVVVVTAKTAGNMTLRGVDSVRVMRRHSTGHDNIEGEPVTTLAQPLAPTTLSLAPLGVVDVRNGLRARFTLPRPGDADLELYDVGGRRLATRALGRIAGGEHETVLASPAGLRPGVYFVVLRYAGESRFGKAVVLR